MTRWIRGLLMMTLIAGGMFPLHAEEVDGRFEMHQYTSKSGQTIPYRLLSPSSMKPGVKYPLVLFLHGAGERGTDNEAQLIHVMPQLMEPEMRNRYPAFVLAPQCPPEKQWVEVPWGADSHAMPETPSEPLSLVMELLKSTSESLPVDRDRVYFTGLSMGGFGVWDLLHRQPDSCAGALIICGGGDPAQAARSVNVPVWSFHGDQDGVVKLHRSVEMIEALRKAGGRPILTVYPGVQHNSWTVTAENRLVWDWLFAQSRP